MKVKQLKKLLNKLTSEKDNYEVILQEDAEGNGYSPLAGIDDNAIYIAENTWSGEVYDKEYTAEEHCLEEAEWEKMKKNPKLSCVVLFPNN